MTNKDRLLSDLRNLQCDRLSVQIMHDDIARISADLDCISQTPVAESSAHPANPDVASLQEERSRLLAALQLTVNHVSRLERLLQMLSPEEQLVIDCMLVNPYKKCTMDLMTELHCEMSSVYRLRARAIEKLLHLRYGACATQEPYRVGAGE